MKRNDYVRRKFSRPVKVGCDKCQLIYWREYNPMKGCCLCGGDIVEAMFSQSDYDWQEQITI